MISPSADSARPRVLFVDDDPDLLGAMARNLRSSQFDVRTATGAGAALEFLKTKGPIAVLVSDLRMPGMGGVELLRQARLIAPDTSRVLFTGQLDIEHALSAVNEGAIFRFMIKPCAIIAVIATIRAAAEQYRLVTTERVLLEQTLRGSVQALSEVLGLASPVAFGRATRVRQVVSELASAMHIAERWHVEIAAMLSQIGWVTLPPATIEKVCQGKALSDQEQAMMSRLPGVTEQVLNHIPRLEPVVEILRYSRKHFDGSGLPGGSPAGEEIPWGARALKTVLDLDDLENEYDSQSLAFDTLLGRTGWYDPAILKVLAEIRAHQAQSEVREISLAGVVPGMMLAKDVRVKNGVLYMARGQAITASALEKLRNWSSQLQDVNAFRVVVRGGTAAGEPVP
jgi:response regulator RpfG family c-di-GMP phosphodiesterase